MRPTEGGKLELELERCGTEAERVVERVLVDRVLAHVGYRPDTALTAELQVHYCYATEGPMKLAAALMAAGGGGGDCLAQVGGRSAVSPPLLLQRANCAHQQSEHSGNAHQQCTPTVHTNSALTTAGLTCRWRQARRRSRALSRASS